MKARISTPGRAVFPRGAAPAAVWALACAVGPAAAGGAEPPLSSSRELLLHFRIEDRGAADLRSFTLYYTRDGGGSWVPYEGEHRGASPFPFSAGADGRYGFKITARDVVDRGTRAPLPGAAPDTEVIVDTEAPRIRILRPAPGARIPVGGALEIEWDAADAHLAERPVSIDAALDEGPWEAVWDDLPARGRRAWLVPFTRGALRLRVRAGDRAGNVATAVTERGLIIAPALVDRPGFLLVPPIAGQRAVPLYYRLEHPPGTSLAPEAIESVRVWFRRPGESWQAGDADRDLVSPLVFQPPSDGHFEVMLAARARDGVALPPGVWTDNSAPPPPESSAHGAVLVDTHEPRVRILEPAGGARLRRGGPLRIAYECIEENLETAEATLSFSTDGGATWTDFPARAALEAAGSEHRWAGAVGFDLPMVVTPALLLRVAVRDAAGNVGTAATPVSQPIEIGDTRDTDDNARRRAGELYRRAMVELSSDADDACRRAIELLRAALDERDDFAAAHHDLAVAMERAREVDAGAAALGEIIDRYERSLRLAPDDLELRFSVIGALVRLAGGLDPAARGEALRRAREAFSGIRREDLLEEPDDLERRRRIDGLRRTHARWKESVFAEVGEPTNDESPVIERASVERAAATRAGAELPPASPALSPAAVAAASDGLATPPAAADPTPAMPATRVPDVIAPDVIAADVIAADDIATDDIAKDDAASAVIAPARRHPSSSFRVADLRIEPLSSGSAAAAGARGLPILRAGGTVRVLGELRGFASTTSAAGGGAARKSRYSLAAVVSLYDGRGELVDRRALLTAAQATEWSDAPPPSTLFWALYQAPAGLPAGRYVIEVLAIDVEGLATASARIEVEGI